jgi:hypothetical protein
LLDEPGRLYPRTEEWVAQFYSRIGPANAFNPFIPDGYYRLNLRNTDERAVAACLVELGVKEAGENFREETYNGIPFEVSPYIDAPRTGRGTRRYLETLSGWPIHRRLVHQGTVLRG